MARDAALRCPQYLAASLMQVRWCVAGVKGPGERGFTCPKHLVAGLLQVRWWVEGAG